MQNHLPLLGQVTPPVRSRLPIFASGFRPFFLVAAAFATGMMPLWLLTLRGRASPAHGLDPTLWHAHEMIFGFAVAVIAGFLLTAVTNWTQRTTATGAALFALASLWIAGRLAMTVGGVGYGLAAAIDLAFLPALFVTLARPIVAARNRRNFVMLAIVGALFACNLGMHAGMLGWGYGWSRTSALVAIDVVLLVMVIVSGRVIPMFTRNATGGAAIESIPSLDRAAIAAVAALIVVDGVAPGSAVAALFAAAAGAIVIARSARWGTLHTGKVPLLWVLHLGHAWMAIGLLLRAAPLLGLGIPPSLATHAIATGAIGTLTLGMMARVALGHTGRPLIAPRSMSVAFVLVTLAALTRVIGPLVAPELHAGLMAIAGGLFAAAFALYLVVYAPILVRPRADGKPG